jgi:hypothetical protein
MSPELRHHHVMYAHWGANTLVVLVTALTVALAVLMHYEGLRWISARLNRLTTVRRRKVLFGVYAVVLLHVAEIWLFGTAMWVLMQVPEAGGLSGTADASFFDVVYLSANTFSTVGFGDVVPVGPLRFLCGTEALSGFILITWSASFVYLEMREFWRLRD